MLWTSFGVFNAPTIMSCVRLGRSLRFWMQSSVRCTSRVSRGWLLQLPRVGVFITIAFDSWIDIRHSSLFSSVGWEVESKAMGWRCVFIPPHSSRRSLFTTIAFIFRHFFSQKNIFPPDRCYAPLKICGRNTGRWE